MPAFSKVLGTAPPLAVHGSVSQEGESARDHDVSGMAPPSHIMRAQRSRIAANMSNMAALIFKNICRRQQDMLGQKRVEGEIQFAAGAQCDGLEMERLE